jgi:hypothetical protein
MGNPTTNVLNLTNPRPFFCLMSLYILRQRPNAVLTSPVLMKSATFKSNLFI